MNPIYEQNGVSIFCHNAMNTPWPIDKESVQSVVTSPPYFGLRDYGTAVWDGGDITCDHAVPLGRKGGNAIGTKQTTNPGSYGYREWLVCGKCGAKRIDDQIGLEASPELYTEKLVFIFREIKRVLKSDGTVWLNLGDTYSCGTSVPQKQSKDTNVGHWNKAGSIGNVRANVPGIPPKNLIGIPWRVAFALQADGWYLRQDIIWHKPNPMPESVTDRCTKAHEYIFLLSKSDRYIFNNEAIGEPLKEIPHKAGNKYHPDKTSGPNDRGGNSQWETSMDRVWGKRGWANKKSVWTIPPQAVKEAHFATFPEKLAELCILAGSRCGDTILDPFIGSGTTALVGKKYNRKAIGLEINPKYIDICKSRLKQNILPLEIT